MKVLGIKNNYLKTTRFNSPMFTSKVKSVNYGALSDLYKDKVDKFDDGDRSETKYLGSGLFASVFKFKDSNYVIKKFNKDVSKSDCYQEARMLEKVGSISGSQQLVAEVTTEKGIDYLISTLVKGDDPDPFENPFTQQALKTFTNTLFELDKKGIYHNDLNSGNCKVDPETGRIGLLDYQFAMEIDMSSARKEETLQNLTFPECTIPANMQMFEMATLATYIKKLSPSQAEKFFKEYLSVKGEYHSKRYHYYKSLKAPYLTPENIKYERLMSQVLRKPKPEIVDIYAKKLEVMHSFRKAFGITDENTREIKKPNLPNAGPAFLYAAFQATEYLEKADNLIRNSREPNIVELMKIEKKVAEYWQRKLANSAEGCTEWNTRNVIGKTLGNGDKYPQLMDKYYDGEKLRMLDVYDTIKPQSSDRGKIDTLRFYDDTILERNYKSLFDLTDSLSRKDFSTNTERDLYARFNSQFKDYESALNSAKVLVLPLLHAYALYSITKLYNVGSYNSKVFLIKDKLETMAEPLLKQVLRAVKGESYTLTQALKKDVHLCEMSSRASVAENSFKDYVKRWY